MSEAGTDKGAAAEAAARPDADTERPHGDKLDEALPVERDDVVETEPETPVEAPGGDEEPPHGDELAEALRKADEYLDLAQRAQAQHQAQEPSTNGAGHDGAGASEDEVVDAEVVDENR